MSLLFAVAEHVEEAILLFFVFNRPIFISKDDLAVAGEVGHLGFTEVLGHFLTINIKPILAH